MSAKGEMRLGYITSQYPAASHTFVRREVEALREEGWNIDTFSVRPPGRDETAGQADRSEAAQTFYLLRQSPVAFIGAHLTFLLMSPLAYARTLALALRHRAPGARNLFLATAHFAESVLLAKELRQRRIVHLHNHFANSAATVGLLATRLLNIRWSFTLHGISETDYPACLILGRKIEFADFIACVSYFGRAQGMRLVSPENWQKMHVIRCGIPFDRLPQEARADRGAATLICVGRLSPEKGQTGLLHAFAALHGRHPEISLRLVGDGPDRALLATLVQELGLDGVVSFAGRLPEIETLTEIARSDMLILPSFMEGLPIVLMEAMALGVPVVASRVAGIPELVTDGATGLLFAPSDWDGLEMCVERLLRDDARRAFLAEKGKATVAEEFDTRRSATKLGELFVQAGNSLQ